LTPINQSGQGQPSSFQGQTGLRRALRSRVSEENIFGSFFEEQRLNKSFKYATLPRNFRRPKPDITGSSTGNSPGIIYDFFSPNNSLVKEEEEKETSPQSKAIWNLRVMNTMTLGRKSLIDSSPLNRQTQRDQGAFAKYLNTKTNTNKQINKQTNKSQTQPPTPNNTPVKNDNPTYRPAKAAAKQLNFK